MNRHRYTIILELLASSSVPDEIRLRRLLKLAGRSFAMKCIDVREVDESIGGDANAPRSATPKRKSRVAGQPSPVFAAQEGDKP